jgi:MFS family permease
LINKKRFPKIFPGWWIVVSGGIIALWGEGFRFYGFPALFKPIASELGFSRAVTSIAASIGRFEGAFEAPIGGWITDKFGAKWIVLAGVFLLGLGLVLMNYVNSLWMFYLVWGVIVSTGGNFAFAVPMETAIANWFVKKRGRAISFKWVLSGLSGVAVLPFVAWLIVNQGWRMTCVIGGLGMWIIGIPLVIIFLKQHRPEYYGLLPDGTTAEEATSDKKQMIERGVKYAAEAEEVEFTLRQTLRTPSFWLLVVASSISGLAMPAFNVHSIPFLTDIGIPTTTAATILATMVAASIPVRFIGGMLADRVQKRYLRFLLAGAHLIQAIGFASFLIYRTTAMVYVWFILYGFGNGAGVGIRSPLRARYFGRKSFGSVFGATSLLMLPVGIIGPIYLGWVYDNTGSYITAFTLIAALCVFASIVMLFAVPPKPPAQVTGINDIL